MRRDHRPYWLKKTYRNFEKFYAMHFLCPHFEHFGKGHTFMRPWNIEVFGSPVVLGDYATLIANRDQKIRFSVWPVQEDMGRIVIGRYCLSCPGVRISSGMEIRIGDSCMIASGAYITDADWHGVYDRIGTGTAAAVTISDNVWIGDQAIICKGVTIGLNSIIGAGSVVVKPVPDNVIVAGNPARVVKSLDEDTETLSRGNWFENHACLSRELKTWDQALLKNNSVMGWLRYLLFPRKGD